LTARTLLSVLVANPFRARAIAAIGVEIDAESKQAGLGAPFTGSGAATGRIAAAQAEGRYGLSEGAADVFEVTPMFETFCALLLLDIEIRQFSRSA
jgi:hypothetical protein